MWIVVCDYAIAWCKLIAQLFKYFNITQYQDIFYYPVANHTYHYYLICVKFCLLYCLTTCVAEGEGGT